MMNEEPTPPAITHTANRFSPTEILLRPSGLLPSHQQVELLRAVPSGQTAPPEELLRATLGNEETTNSGDEK